jgi:hypothetical protein
VVTVTPANAWEANEASAHTISDRGDFRIIKSSEFFIGLRNSRNAGKTPFRASGRMPGPEEMAQAVAFFGIRL